MEALFCQGNRILSGQYLEQIIGVPAAFQALSFYASLDCSLQFEQIERHVPQDRKVLGGMILADPAVIFIEGDIEHPMQAVLNAPIAAFGL